MKIILIDVNSIVNGLATGKTTGIGRTTLELVKAFEAMEELPFELVLYSQNVKGVGSSYFSGKFKKSHWCLPYRRFINLLFAKFPIKEIYYKYDLMHIPSNYGYVFAPHKTIFTLHDAFFMKITDVNFDYHQMRNEVPEIMQKAKAVVTCSQYSKKDITETMHVEGDKISVIYWGYNSDVFKPIKSNHFGKLSQKFGLKDDYFISYSCSVGRKNTDILIRAFLSHLKNGGVHDLVLVWSDPPLYLIKEIENSGYGDRIFFLNDVDDLTLASLLQHSVALIFPSSYEGFGLPVLEALACGTLVLIANNSSLPEVGGSAAFYLDDLTIEGICLSIEKLILNLDKREYYISLGLKQAAKFSWEKTAKEYVKLYEKQLNY